MTEKQEHWYELAEKLRQLNNRPPLRIRDVQKILGYYSTSATLYAVKKMVDLGLIEFEQRGKRKEYYLHEIQEPPTETTNDET